jgi:hypothetical protein
LLFENTSIVADVVLILSASFAFFFVWLLRPRDHEGAVLSGRLMSIPTLDSEWCGLPAPRSCGQDSARAEQETWPSERPARDAGRMSRPLRVGHALGDGDVGQKGAHQRSTVALFQPLEQVDDEVVHGGLDRKADAFKTRPPFNRLRSSSSPWAMYDGEPRSTAYLTAEGSTKDNAEVKEPLAGARCLHLVRDEVVPNTAGQADVAAVARPRRWRQSSPTRGTFERTRSIPSSVQEERRPRTRSEMPAHTQIARAYMQTVKTPPVNPKSPKSPVNPKSPKRTQSSGSLFYSNVVKVAASASLKEGGRSSPVSKRGEKFG